MKVPGSVTAYVHNNAYFLLTTYCSLLTMKVPGSVTTYVHNNAYTEEELPECFERNSEGLLKNMARICIAYA